MTLRLKIGVLIALVLACQLCQAVKIQEKSSYSARNDVNLWNTFIDDETYTIPWRLDPKDPWAYNSTLEYIPIVAKQLEENTCLRFKPWSGEKSWLLLWPVSYGCWTQVGRPDEGDRFVNLSPWCGITLMHEVMHTLGFIHEQQRPDRDQYITVDLSNVAKKNHYSFDKEKKEDLVDLGLPYDLDSVMQYGSDSFKKDKSLPGHVMLTLDGKTFPTGRNLSELDIKEINKLYGCDPVTKKILKSGSQQRSTTPSYRKLTTPDLRTTTRSTRNYRTTTRATAGSCKDNRSDCKWLQELYGHKCDFEPFKKACCKFCQKSEGSQA